MLASAWLAGGVILLGACAPVATVATHRGLDGPRRESRSTWVVRGEQMVSGMTVLDGLRSRFPGMDIRQNSGCPDLVIRGHNSIESSNAPQVYVDGSRAGDTCILGMLRAGDVARVEVYPTGHTSRAGYLPNPNGLVLVFTRRAVPD